MSLPSTYAGGLGFLAGDTIQAAADLGLPLVAVSLVYRQGYFHQRFAGDGQVVAAGERSGWWPGFRVECLGWRESARGLTTW